MDELILKLHKTTLAMEQAIDQGKFQELNNLLDERNNTIAKVDSLLTEEHQYSPNAKLLLREIQQLDKQIAIKITRALSATEILINQQLINKQVSKKFQPYNKQTSGVFFDEKK